MISPDIASCVDAASDHARERSEAIAGLHESQPRGAGGRSDPEPPRAVAEHRREPVHHGPAGAYRQSLVIRSIGRVQLVDVAEIDWVKASGNYLEVHAGAASFLYRERLHVLEHQLDPADFVRIHRSIIVRRSAVAEIRPLGGGDHAVVLRGGEQLRLSRTFRSALPQWITER